MSDQIPQVTPSNPAPATPAPTTPPATPLGVDPAPAPAATVPPVVAKPAAPQKPTMTQAEIDALVEKANNYDLIAGEPELVTRIGDHFRAKTGRVAQPATPAPATLQEPQDNPDKAAMQELVRRNAANEIALFRLQNPDMDTYRDDMVHLISNYGMSLADAYRFSKATKAQQKPTTPAQPARPTVETTNPAGIVQNDEFDLQTVENKIRDPKATPRMDDAIDLAIATARRMHASN